jgi:general secretion pathway protein J
MRRNRTEPSEIERGDRRAGFLLVEVLATMTISALLLAALFSITSLTARVSGRIERKTAQIEDRTRLLAALAREIERAAPLRWAGKNGTFIFGGNARSLTFATEFPSPNNVSEVKAVFIDSAGAITRRVALVGPTATSFTDIAIGQPESMSGNQLELTFSYFARLPDGQEALLQTWPDATRFPVAIRLTLSGADGPMSSLRVKLAVDAEPGCGFPEAGGCSLRPIANKEQAVSSLPNGDGG